jgi:AraC-like DNA-binding protein
MPGSVTSVLSGAGEFQAALSNEGSVSLFVTTCGQFRARLTQVELHRLRLSAVEEHLPRIGFVAVSSDMVLVAFPIGDQPGPIWGGIRPRKGEFMTFGPGHRVHMRTQGHCRFGTIWFPARDLAGYFQELTDVALVIPAVAHRWRFPPSAGRRLLQFHAAAIRAAEIRPETIVNVEAAHGMEQQLIDALVECLSAGPCNDETAPRHRHQSIVARFEELLGTEPHSRLRVEDLSTAIGVSGRLLRMRCKEELGMSPTCYFRLRALHRVHDVLRGRDSGVTGVSQVARRHGFSDLGRFAAAYRALFGELPSATLKRNLRR